MNQKPKLLLQICCGPCATQSIKELEINYDVYLFFDGSNIHPKEEYLKRLNAVKIVNEKLNSNKPLVINQYNPENFFLKTKGFEAEPEGKTRCEICIGLRLAAALEYAAKNNFPFIASSLSVSPHKNPKMIDQIAENLIKKNGYKIAYIKTNLKLNNGFKKSVDLSRELNIYRQNYCGCKFSVRNK